jgi:cation transport protein ChaC
MNAPDPHPKPHSAHSPLSRPLSREDLRQGSMRDLYLKSELAGLAWSDAQLEKSIRRTLAVARHVPRSGDIWVFAYGSLIWNPLFPVAEKRLAKIYGYHRSFCLWSRVGRGTRDNPGLVLGLDHGGACAGLALRIDASHAREELSLLWRREMVTGAYAPTWVRARTSAGAVDAIAFVIDHRSHAYAGRLPEAAIASNIREAAGVIGPCAEYLEKTAAGLAAHGIDDVRLARLARLCGCAA